MVEFIRILAANTRGQFSFVIITVASTRCLVENFQAIHCSQRVNSTWKYNDSGSSFSSKLWNDRIVVVVKNCWFLVQGRRSCREI